MKRGPERQLLPAFDAQVNDVLNVKPFVAFLFVGPSKRERNIKELEVDSNYISDKYIFESIVFN